MANEPDNAKQVLEEALRQLYQRAGTQLAGNNYLQGGDGQFLGRITDNPFDQDSITNQYGPYGSKYSPTSIHNQYSNYGSLYSGLSINSIYASNPPVLFLNGIRRGVITKNPYLLNRIDTDVFLYLLENNLRALLIGEIPERVPAPINARVYLQASDGTFLGSLERNAFKQDSIFNKFGPYGSQFSPTSIFNQFGSFGGRFSPLSPYNAFTTTPPVIVIGGRQVAYLTKNKYIAGEKVDPDQLDGWLRLRGL